MNARGATRNGSLAGYFLCALAFAWIALDNFQLRQTLRSSLREAYSLISKDEVNRQPGKVVNGYYESVYPGLLLTGGAAILWGSRRHERQA